MIVLLLWGCAPEAVDSDEPEVAAIVDCPPPEPGGLEVGDPVIDVGFTDCAGAPVSLHGLCGQPALIANWYGWCPSCETNAAFVRDLAQEHPGLAVAVVLDEDPLGAPVDAEFCGMYVEAKPSVAAVWMDPGGALEIYGDTDLILVLDAEGTVTFKRQTATEAAIRAAVEAALD